MACMALHQNNFVSTYSHFNFLEKWEVEIRVEDLNEQDKKLPFISKRKTSKSFSFLYPVYHVGVLQKKKYIITNWE